MEGTVLASDARGTVLFEARDSRQYIISLQERIKWEKKDQPVSPFTRVDLKSALQSEFGSAFRTHSSTHYLIVYSCEPEFAKDAAKLFELTYSRFMNYFERRGKFDLKDPAQPLIAVIYANRDEYIRNVSGYLGTFADKTAGIYIPATNRMFMYNAFGGKALLSLRKELAAHRPTVGQITALLRFQNISVVIHEAVHQIAFNCGFHNRNVQNPMWLVEGMAMFFEVPDLDSKTGLGDLGSVNEERLAHYAKLPQRNRQNALAQLVTDDGPFRNPQLVADAYAEAWALTYYLARTRTKEYMNFIRQINGRPAMQPYTSEARLADFRAAFGQTPEQLDADFRRSMSRLLDRRPRK